MKKYYLLLVAVVICLFVATRCCDEFDKLSNEEKVEYLEEDIFTYLALIEGDKGEGKPYFCGSRWTIWFGTTVYPDGTRVKKSDKPVSREEGKEFAIAHIRKYVKPFFKYFVRPMTKEQVIGTALFIYNVGGEAVTGYNLKGEKVGEPSQFLTEFNRGANDDICVAKFTRYRMSNGKRATGLMKRHWVEGAVYKGLLTVENIQELCPERLYVTKNLGNYYWLDSKRNVIMTDGDCHLRYDDTALKTFFRMNKAKPGEKSVKSIIP